MSDFSELWESVEESRDYTHTKIFSMVRGLGQSADAIAQNLQLEGVVGNRQLSTSCALSAYVMKHFPEAQVETSGSTMSVSTNKIDDDRAICYLPEGHSEFVRKFDSGAYPELIVKPADIR